MPKREDLTSVIILTENYRINGSVALTPGARLTDYIVEAKEFIAVVDADVSDHLGRAVLSAPFLNVHRAHVDMALSAFVNAAQRKIFIDAGQALADQGAETVLLGGTDLFLAFDGQTVPFGTLDCASVHIDAIARAASRSSP